MTNAWFADPPGKVDFLPFMSTKKLDMPCLDIAEKTTHREDRFDILGELLDGFFKRVDAVLQVVFFFQKTVRALGRANKLMHEKGIVGATVGFFFLAEMLQAFFELGQ